MNLKNINIKRIIDINNAQISSEYYSTDEIINIIKGISKENNPENKHYIINCKHKNYYELKECIEDLVLEDFYYIKDYKDFLIDEFDNLDDKSLLRIHTEFNEYDHVYDNTDPDFFDRYFENTDDAVRAVCYGDYEYMAPFVRFNGYGNLETTWNLKDFIYIDELADYVAGIDYLKNKYFEYLDQKYIEIFDKIEEYEDDKEKMKDLKEMLNSYRSDDDKYQNDTIDDLIEEIDERV